jgi:hypothetical protein
MFSYSSVHAHVIRSVVDFASCGFDKMTIIAKDEGLVFEQTDYSGTRLVEICLDGSDANYSKSEDDIQISLKIKELGEITRHARCGETITLDYDMEVLTVTLRSTTPSSNPNRISTTAMCVDRLIGNILCKSSETTQTISDSMRQSLKMPTTMFTTACTSILRHGGTTEIKGTNNNQLSIQAGMGGLLNGYVRFGSNIEPDTFTSTDTSPTIVSCISFPTIQLQALRIGAIAREIEIKWDYNKPLCLMGQLIAKLPRVQENGKKSIGQRARTNPVECIGRFVIMLKNS